MVMEKLLEKLRCRTISAATGSEAIRYAMSDIKFDIMFLEFRLPKLSGSDVARMIRDTKHINMHTPLVAITSYLKELPAPQYFDSLVEKPISSSKLTEVLSTLCHWKPPSPGQANSPSLALPHPIPSGLRTESLRLEDSPTSASSGYAMRSGSSVREDSISSSLFGDSESVATDDIPVLISRKATGDWDEGGLCISGPEDQVLLGSNNPLGSPLQPRLITQQSAPPQIDSSPLRAKGPAPQRSLEKLKAKRESIEKRRYEGSVDSADDEDDELGLGAAPAQTGNGNGSGSGSGSSNGSASGSNPGSPLAQQYRSKSVLPSSKLGIEMMRANSHDSLLTGSECASTVEPATQVVTPNQEVQLSFPEPDPMVYPVTHPVTPAPHTVAENQGQTPAVVRTPPELETGTSHDVDVDETPRPSSSLGRNPIEDEDPTPRRPPAKTADRDDTISPLPGGI
jgi:serine/threonine-protein kinase RIM15